MSATLTTIEPRVTSRALVDPSRKCSLRCSFCYYLPTDDLHTVQPWEQQRQQVLDARARGCDCCDISGGEPLQNPHVVDLVKLCADEGLPARIITSLICPEKVLDGVLDAGVADWLISMHGAREETHNAIVSVPKARQLQLRRIAKISERMDWCTNYVMVERNQTEMAEWARWLVSLDRRPKIANFINFNVFAPWLRTPEWKAKGMANVVDPRVAGPILDEAIDMLEDAGIGVNVRYAPMCMVAERHRKNICNDLHVAFDQGEWDNAIPSHELDAGERYGRTLSGRNEMNGEPCSGCGLHSVCGGANENWHRLATEKFGCEVLVPQETPVALIEPEWWHYRGHNVAGLDPRRPAPRES